MSNISLTGNPGTSLNFDGAELQNLQEAECRKEEEQQQNELRALLTNAFDDLIDEDDILSITSEEGTDSRNVSLVRRASNDSFGKLVGEEKIDEASDTDADWGGGYCDNPVLASTGPLNHGPKFDIPLSRTHEFPRHEVDIVRRSVDRLQNVRASHDSDLNSNPSFHGSRDQLDSDYHSNTEEPTNKKADFYGNVYPMDNHLEGTRNAQSKMKKGFKKEQQDNHNQNNSKSVTSDRTKVGHGQTTEAKHLSTKERENILRKSIEDLAKFQNEALTIQGSEQFYGAHGTQETGQGHQFQGQDHQTHGHHQWQIHSDQNAPERPYDEGYTPQQQHSGQLQGQGHYYPDFQGQGHPGHNYDQHYGNHHHDQHFRNSYEGHQYHTAVEREGTENENPGRDDHYYHYHGHYGYYQNNNTPYANSTDRGFYSHTTGFTDTQHLPPQATPNEYHQSHPNIQNQDEIQSHPNENQNFHQRDPNQGRKDHLNDQKVKEPVSPRKSKESFPEGYKVNYQKGQDEKEKGTRKDKTDEKRQSDRSKEELEKVFMHQVGTADDQQMAQLQILYKARGSKIEDLISEMELLKQGMGREIRILKHQLNMAKGEKEGATKSLDSCQELLAESKSENAQLLGRVHAAESQIEGLKKGKEELIKKLQTSESTVENLHQHLEELGRSDSLSRARHEHEVVVSGLQKKYETEIKVLKEKIDKMNESLAEKDDEISTLKQKLTESRKTAENLQISRAETINRLTQSLEESQKRCRNLLESTSSQDMSQMKVQLQQALASKSISEEMCCSLQDEIKDLKEQVQMLESASSLGINGHGSSTSTGFVDQNDSLIDLGIKKTLDYDTPQGTPTVLRSQSAFNTSNEVVSSLKAELERCLISNRQKRAQVMELKEELKTVKKDMLEYKQRCERAEVLSQEQKKRIAELESCVNTDDNVIENRLKKDIENLRREKKVLLGDIEELQNRLEEISKSEQKLTELNQELRKQISDMVKEYDQDKREAVERVQRACDQVSETSRKQLRDEMILHFDTERSALIAKYEKEENILRDELRAAEAEIDRVKTVYVSLCEEKDMLEENLTKQWTEKMDEELKNLRETLDKDHSLAALRLEENLEKKHETEISKLKSDFENERIKLETQKSEKIEKLQEDMKVELETEKSKLKMEFENEKLKLQNEKLQEIERIGNEFKKRSIEIQEKDEVITVKDLEIIKIQEKCETELKYLKEKYEAQLKSQKESAEKEKQTLQEKLENEIKTLQDILEKEKLNDIEKLRKEKTNEIERLNQEIGKLKLEIERLNKELEVQMNENVRVDKENKAVIDKLNKEIQEQKEVLQKNEKFEEEQKTVLDTVLDKLKEREAEIERISKCSDTENKALAERLMDKDEELEKTKEMLTNETNAMRTLKDSLSELERRNTEYKVVIERLRQEKDEIEKQLKNMEENIESIKVEFRDVVRTEMEAEVAKTVETKVAMSKCVWLEEHRATRQTAIDNAVKLAEAELKQTMEAEVEAKVEKRLQEAQLTWQSDSLNHLQEERANWEILKQEAVKAALQEEKKIWIQTELQQELENEKQKWTQELEVKYEQEKESWKVIELETEKLNWTMDWEEKLKKEKATWIKNELEPAKQKWRLESDERLRLERENWRSLELETEKLNLMKEMEERIAKEKKSWMIKVLPEEIKKEKLKWDRDYIDKIQREKEAWHTYELPKEIAKERKKWISEVDDKVTSEKKNWKNSELPDEIEKERKKWMKLLESTLSKEREKWRTQDLPSAIEKERESWKLAIDEEVEKKLMERLEVEKDKLQKVDLAICEARDDWQREYFMEMSINTTSAEASQGLLREEIENLKQKTESLQSELLRQEEEWLKEKQDLIAQKDEECRKAVAAIQDQNEAEYKQFIDEHKDTLDHALKAAREQHTQEKYREQAQLQEQFQTELSALQTRERTLQQQLQDSLHSTKDQSDALMESDKERMLWYEEREQLLQDIADRDALLGKADIHLSKEIEKLRSELQATYQRRLESEMHGWKQKIESEYSRVTNAEQKEKLHLEKQLSEVTTELNKVKSQMKEIEANHTEEIKRLNNEINERQKKSDVEKVEIELKRAKELVNAFKTEAEDYQQKCQRYKSDLEEIQGKMSRMVQNQEKLQTELQKIKEEKSALIESVQSIESSYHKDVAAYKQKQEESALRIAKTENILQSMKQKYRTELENLRKALEAENEVAMEAMKNKMVELQKKHVMAMEELKKRHIQEREEILSQTGSSGKVPRGVTPIAGQGESEDLDKVVQELRNQYLNTVTKIKDDVLRHVTHTNVRAAETVKHEMDKERSSTFQQIKEFYKNNVRQILETEIIGSNLESKLMAVEEALETLSSNPSSRSTTPKSDDFCLDERGRKILSRSTPRDAGISPQSQRQVSFTSDKLEGERSSARSRTPVGHGREMSIRSPERQEHKKDDPRSPKNRMERTKSPRDVNITVRERRPEMSLRSSREWNHESLYKDTEPYTPQQRPLSAKSARETHTLFRHHDADDRDFARGDDYVTKDNDSLNLSRKMSDKRRSRVVISTRDIHSGRYKPVGMENVNGRAKSVTPLHNTLALSSPSLYRPTSVPDLTSDEKELKVWDDSNENTYRYTSLRESLRTGSNLTRSNSKSESDLRIAESSGGFAPLRSYDSTNLDLSTGSLSSCDTFASERGMKSRDAGETPTSTPRRYKPRKHYTVDSFPTRDPITGEFITPSKEFNVSSKTDTSTPNIPREKRALPLIQFRHGKMQTLSRTPLPNSKSPHADNQPIHDTASSDHRYRPLSVSSHMQMDL